MLTAILAATCQATPIISSNDSQLVVIKYEALDTIEEALDRHDCTGQATAPHFLSLAEALASLAMSSTLVETLTFTRAKQRAISLFPFLFLQAFDKPVFKRRQRSSDESNASHLLLLFAEVSPAAKLLLLILTGHCAPRVPARARSRASTRFL